MDYREVGQSRTDYNAPYEAGQKALALCLAQPGEAIFLDGRYQPIEESRAKWRIEVLDNGQLHVRSLYGDTSWDKFYEPLVR